MQDLSLNWAGRRGAMNSHKGVRLPACPPSSVRFFRLMSLFALGTPVRLAEGFLGMDQKQYRAWLAEYDFIGVANRRKHEQEQREAEASAQNEKPMETKVCKTCGRTLPISAFSACVLTADKLQPNCKECMSSKQKSGWVKKAKAIVEAEVEDQPNTKSMGHQLCVKPEALKSRPEEKNKAEQVVEAVALENIPDWVLSAELRRRGFIVKVYKECNL